MLQSCAAPTAFCDRSVQPGGACYGCRNFADCPAFNTNCNLATHTCEVNDAGAGAGGGSGGGVTFDDAGLTARCLPFDAGAKSCTSECTRGYVCVNGVCKLHGSSGPVQVTLRFPVAEDLDLHLVEPLSDGGSCEIYYANRGNTPDSGIVFPFPIPMPFACGARGYLDLDSNAACTIDNVDVENVIYPPSAPAPTGKYIVRVVYYQNCGATQNVPYEVEVRANGQTRYYCGSFPPNGATGGNQGAGTTITQFVIP